MKKRPPKLTPAEARAFRKRWKTVNDAERKELRRTSPTLKMRQLSTLMTWARDCGWNEKLASEDEEVRERWKRIREYYGA